MSRRFIVVGDATTGGGTVITGSPFTDIDGIPVSRINDKATCTTHKGVFPIVSGDVTIIIDGQPVAREGDYLACGCRLIAGRQFRAFTDDGPAAGAAVADAMRQRNSTPSTTAAGYDEAVRFLSHEGNPLGRLNYKLFLDDGAVVSGVTDEDGTTARVLTARPQKLLKAELSPSHEESSCCGMPAKTVAEIPSIGLVDTAEEQATVMLAGLATNSQDIGSSVADAKVDQRCRKLTLGEIAMARLVFGDAIRYADVEIHEHGYWLFFGLQGSRTAVAPNGNIYLPKPIYSADFSLVTEIDDSPTREQRRALFVHEMTHVWQFQLGYPLKRVRGPRPNMTYRYTLELDKRLSDYNMEQQGDILADYFLIKIRGKQELINESQYAVVTNVIPLYERVLQDFLRAPAQRANLPQVP